MIGYRQGSFYMYMNIYSKRGITQFLHFDIAILDIQCNAAMPEQLNIKYFGIFVIKRF